MKRATGIMTMVLAGSMLLGSVPIFASETAQADAYQQLMTQFVTLSQNESPLAYARLVAEPVMQDPSDKSFTDLVALRVGEDVVLRGKGDCRFTRANEAWHFDGGDLWSTAFAATWEPGAGWPSC